MVALFKSYIKLSPARDNDEYEEIFPMIIMMNTTIMITTLIVIKMSMTMKMNTIMLISIS